VCRQVNQQRAVLHQLQLHKENGRIIVRTALTTEYGENGWEIDRVIKHRGGGGEKVLLVWCLVTDLML